MLQLEQTSWLCWKQIAKWVNSQCRTKATRLALWASNIRSIQKTTLTDKLFRQRSCSQHTLLPLSDSLLTGPRKTPFNYATFCLGRERRKKERPFHSLDKRWMTLCCFDASDSPDRDCACWPTFCAWAYLRDSRRARKKGWVWANEMKKSQGMLYVTRCVLSISYLIMLWASVETRGKNYFRHSRKTNYSLFIGIEHTFSLWQGFFMLTILFVVEMFGEKGKKVFTILEVFLNLWQVCNYLGNDWETQS